MIAVALNDILDNVAVLYNEGGVGAYIRVRPKPCSLIFIPLPEIAFQKMQLFDCMNEFSSKHPDIVMKHREMIEPFEFEISLTTSLINHIGISQVYKVLSESRTLELISINEIK